MDRLLRMPVTWSFWSAIHATLRLLTLISLFHTMVKLMVLVPPKLWVPAANICQREAGLRPGEDYLVADGFDLEGGFRV